jgi:hypothetical protein
VQVLSENANIRRSKRSLKRKVVTEAAKRKSPLALLISSERKQERRRKGLQLKGSDPERKAKWGERRDINKTNKTAWVPFFFY